MEKFPISGTKRRLIEKIRCKNTSNRLLIETQHFTYKYKDRNIVGPVPDADQIYTQDLCYNLHVLKCYTNRITYMLKSKAIMKRLDVDIAEQEIKTSPFS